MLIDIKVIEMSKFIVVSICVLSAIFTNVSYDVKKYENIAKSEGIVYSDVQMSPIPFEKDGLFGYIDQNGDIVVEPKYVDAEQFSEGLAVVRKSQAMDMQYGFINEIGEEVIPCKYTVVSNFSCGYAIVSESNKWSTDGEYIYYYINRNGEKVFDQTYKGGKPFSEGYAPVMLQGEVYVSPNTDNFPKWGYIDTEGIVVSEEFYDDAFEFLNGYACVKVNNKYKIIDKSFDYIKTIDFETYGDAIKYIENLTQ